MVSYPLLALGQQCRVIQRDSANTILYYPSIHHDPLGQKNVLMALMSDQSPSPIPNKSVEHHLPAAIYFVNRGAVPIKVEAVATIQTMSLNEVLQRQDFRSIR